MRAREMIATLAGARAGSSLLVPVQQAINLPVEQPTKFNLAISPTLLARADEVLE